MTLFERVQADPPHWADDVLEPYPFGSEADVQEYATSYYWCDSGSVDVHDVSGTLHPDYVGKSWRNLLENGKRMSINLPLVESKPNYYHETVKKSPSMHFRKVNGKTYIHSDGNHRACIARFLFHYQGLTTLHGVTVDEFTIDNEFRKARLMLDNIMREKRIAGNTRVERTTLKRDDTAGWMREQYDLTLHVNDLVLGIDELHELILDSQRPFNKIYGKYKRFWRG